MSDEQRAGRVLVAEDSEDIRMLVCIHLRREGFEVVEAANGTEALRLARLGNIDMALLDVDMPELSGFEVLGYMQEDRETAAVPVVMLTSRADPTFVSQGLDAGAHDYVVKPFEAVSLMARVRSAIRLKRQRDEMNRATDDLSTMALTDALTELANRASAERVLRMELAGAKRSNQEMAVLMVDVDHFKYINDEHGHPVGDEVLREVANRLASGVRESDLVARWGGEEFLVVLPRTDAAGARVVAERVRAAVAAAPIPTRKQPVQVTVSVGVCNDYAAPDIVKLADVALYEAKRDGRNRVTVYDHPESEWTA